jgi:hypothetical protein
MTLGVDIGNVIIDHRDTSKTDILLYTMRYSTIPSTEGVFDALKELQEKVFKENIYLISKCKPWAEPKILAWLKDNDFYQRTGISSDKVFFCAERSEKANICKEKGITHFVDDRLEVLSHLETVPNLFLFKPDCEEVEAFKEFLPKVKVVNNWNEVVKEIL